MRVWKDPRDGSKYKVQVLASGEQIAFWSPTGLWRAMYQRHLSEADLTDLELEELLDRAKPI